MTLRLIAAVSIAALTLTGCSGSSDSSGAESPTVTQGTSDRLVETSPLTGEAMPDGRPDNPVFVVKVENTANGAPQYGLDQADLVIEELVEGGLTRLAAFYYSNIPTKIGHVRSLRTSDIGIAGPVGGQIVATGGQSGAYRTVENAGVTVFSEDDGSPGFSSDPSKSRPYNRLINLATIAKNAKVTPINGPYLPWRASTPQTPSPADGDATAAPTAGAAASQTATSARVRFSSTATTTWALSGGTWARTNGHAESGREFKADTMIVLFCTIGDAGYRDPAGNPVPETKLEGRGKAMVFDGDQVTTVEWVKPGLDESVTFVSGDGQPFTIRPGHSFIELVPKGAGSVTLG